MIRVLLTKVPKRGIQVSIWYNKEDGRYHPLVETLDYMGEPTSGRLLKAGGKLTRVIFGAEDWVKENCPLINSQENSNVIQ